MTTNGETPESGVPRRWIDRRRGMDPENRRRVIEASAVRVSPGWATHFVLMMVLSLLVAIMGLSANSAALVIGAMLLAPLMQPVLGTAASLSMAMGGPLKRSLLVLVMASVGAIALSYVVALFLRDGPLSTEVLARTSPDARDLIVALAAGAAGAYATARADLSASLPGVAIAVALVPPLAVVGMTLEADRWDLSRGALLLYVTNLAAIVVASVVVFLLTGFVPPRRLARTSTRVLMGGAMAFGFMVLVAVPLTIASSRAADQARDREDVESAVRDWLSGTGDEVDEIDIDGQNVTIRILGLGPPRPSASLERQIEEILGSSASVEVRWTQALVAPDEDDGPTEREILEAEIALVVDQWLAAGGDGGSDVTRLEVDGNEVRVDVSSTQPPPTIGDLRARLLAELGVEPRLEVTWSPRTRLEPDSGTRPIDEILVAARRVATDWAQTQEDLAVGEVVYDGSAISVDLIGVVAPDALELERLVLAETNDALPVRIWFTQRERLVPPLPTPTATATPVPTPTPAPSPSPTPAFALAFPTPTPGT